ncbi:MAG: low temperature requirement protein A [Psittacicella sp.]
MFIKKLNGEHPLWTPPIHHFDHAKGHHNIHWLELFYDLIQVVAISAVSDYLVNHLNLFGILSFVMLFIVMWQAWFDISIYHSIYISTDIYHRVLMLLIVTSVAIMSSTLYNIDILTALSSFLIAYGSNKILIGILYLRIFIIEKSNLSIHLALRFLIIGFISIALSFLPYKIAIYTYTIFLIIFLINFTTYFPKVGILKNKRFILRSQHMAERFSLIFLVVCGEGFVQLANIIIPAFLHRFQLIDFVGYGFGISGIFLTTWLYFDFTRVKPPKQIKGISYLKWSGSHLLLVLSIILIDVAIHAEFQINFFKTYLLMFGYIGYIGLILYFLSILFIQQVIVSHAAHKFATIKVRMIGIVIAIIGTIALPYVSFIICNIIWFSALLSQAIIPIFLGYRYFSKNQI